MEKNNLCPKELFGKMIRKQILRLLCWWVLDWKRKACLELASPGSIICTHRHAFLLWVWVFLPLLPLSPNWNILWASAWIRAAQIGILTALKDSQINACNLSLWRVFCFKETTFTAPQESAQRLHREARGVCVCGGRGDSHRNYGFIDTDGEQTVESTFLFFFSVNF